ncbi:Transient receptor potential cation channel subfamily A member 1 [Trichoplax sp. H2]|nr:Transient receptor potential cation channel subfamily A member 1 [Trichoplax sp. H2]|eukprot:RDD41570.1 Transient receptor potential cation channel subfamily A member 1 [Trichoplax sp. H2]
MSKIGKTIRMNSRTSIKSDRGSYGSALSSLAANITAFPQILPSPISAEDQPSGITTVDVAIRQPFQIRRQSTLVKLFSFRRRQKVEELQRRKENRFNIDNINECQTDVSTLYEACRMGLLHVVKTLFRNSNYKKAINVADENLYTPLHYAAANNHVDVVYFLLDNGADINISGGEDFIGPLHIAIKENSYETVKVLVERGAALDKNDKFGLQPLHYASSKGHTNIATYLINRCAKRPELINSVCQDSRTPLHLATFRCCNEIVSALLLANADITNPAVRGRTPLHYAATRKNYEGFMLILNRAKQLGINVIEHCDKENVSTLHIAVDGSCLEIVQRCIDEGADVNAMTNELLTPLHYAATSGNVDIAKLLVDNGALIDTRDNFEMTSLHKAACADHPEMMKYLISQGANIDVEDVDDFTPWMYTVWKGYFEACRLLLELGAEKSCCLKTGKTVMHLAAQQRSFKILKFLLDECCNCMSGKKDSGGFTPFLIAAREGDCQYFRDLNAMTKATKRIIRYQYSAVSIKCSQIVEYLLQKGSKVTSTDNEENSAIHLATKNDHYDMVEMICNMRSEVDVNARNKVGQRPLHFASINGSKRLVKLLLKYGADPEARDNCFGAPIHVAAKSGFRDVISVLLDHSAKIDCRNKNDNTPLHIASINGHVDVIEHLLLEGAPITALNDKNQTCLDVAIEYNQIEVAVAIIKSKGWERVMMSRSLDGYTPMKRLIEKMPIAAEAVMDRCIYHSNHSYDDPDRTTMAELGKKKLLIHPLISAYRCQKWQSGLNFLYYIQALYFIIYLIGTSTNITIEIYGFLGISNNYSNVMKGPVALTPSRPPTEADIRGRIAILILSCLALSRILLVAYFMKCHYFSSILFNILDILLIITSTLFSLPIYEPLTYFRCQIGAVAVFLAYINVLVYFQRARQVGIYIIMFHKVIMTIMKVIFIVILIIVAFTLAFSLTFPSQLEFYWFHIAFVRTMMMMVGDINFAEMVRELHFSGNLSNTGLGFAFFIMLIVLVNLGLVNLLIGLAVGDINKVQRNAHITGITMDICMINEFNRALPLYIRRRLYKPSITIFVNGPRNKFKKFIWIKTSSLASIHKEKSQIVQKCDLAWQIKRQENEINKIRDNLEDVKSDIGCAKDMIRELLVLSGSKSRCI